MTPLALHSPSAAAVDTLRSDRASALTQVLGIVGFALLTVLGAKIRIPLWEVPITLQTLMVYGAGLFLGARNGMLSQVLYLSLGLFLPVFSGDTFGTAYLAGATGGYLIALPFVAFVAGTFSQRWNTLAGSMMALLAGSAVLFTFGVTWLHFAAGHDSWGTSIVRGWLMFVVFDLAKIGLASLFYTGARKVG